MISGNNVGVEAYFLPQGPLLFGLLTHVHFHHRSWESDPKQASSSRCSFCPKVKSEGKPLQTSSLSPLFDSAPLPDLPGSSWSWLPTAGGVAPARPGSGCAHPSPPRRRRAPGPSPAVRGSARLWAGQRGGSAVSSSSCSGLVAVPRWELFWWAQVRRVAPWRYAFIPGAASCSVQRGGYEMRWRTKRSRAWERARREESLQRRRRPRPLPHGRDACGSGSAAWTRLGSGRCQLLQRCPGDGGDKGAARRITRPALWPCFLESPIIGCPPPVSIRWLPGAAEGDGVSRRKPGPSARAGPRRPWALASPLAAVLPEECWAWTRRCRRPKGSPPRLPGLHPPPALLPPPSSFSAFLRQAPPEPSQAAAATQQHQPEWPGGFGPARGKPAFASRFSGGQAGPCGAAASSRTGGQLPLRPDRRRKVCGSWFAGASRLLEPSARSGCSLLGPPPLAGSDSERSAPAMPAVAEALASQPDAPPARAPAVKRRRLPCTLGRARRPTQTGVLRHARDRSPAPGWEGERGESRAELVRDLFQFSSGMGHAARVPTAASSGPVCETFDHPGPFD